MFTQAEIKELRKDFPALNQVNPKNGRPPVYLDNSCMTMKPSAVAEAEWDYNTKYPACGGHRGSYWFAEIVHEKVEAARAALASLIKAPAAKSSEGKPLYPIIFTRNATEGLNLVASTLGLMPGETVLITDKEHNSNLCPWQEFEKRGGKVIILATKADNTFDMPAFKAALAKDRSIKLVSLNHSSNLDGVTNPLQQIVKAVRDTEKKQARNIFIAVDGAQSLPHLPLNLGEPEAPGFLDVDFFAGSIHKMLGPSGIGFLYGKPELLDCLPPYMVGGSTIYETSAYHRPVYAEWPARFEAGLQNYGGIIGAGAAVKYLTSILPRIKGYENHLNGILTDVLKPLHAAGKIRILGPEDAHQRGGVLTLLAPERPEGDRMRALREKSWQHNLMYRTGHFCVDVWFSTRQDKLYPAYTPIRLSAYFYNTESEVETTAKVIREIFA